MTRHQLVYTQSAILELHEAYLYIHNESPDNAAHWRAKLIDAAESLKSSPRRCPLAPENAFSSDEIRQLLFGSYRMLFTIDGDRVVILRIRHTARAPMIPDEFLPPDTN